MCVGARKLEGGVARGEVATVRCSGGTAGYDEGGVTPYPPTGRGLQSFTLELNLSNSRTHS